MDFTDTLVFTREVESVTSRRAQIGFPSAPVKLLLDSWQLPGDEAIIEIAMSSIGHRQYRPRLCNRQNYGVFQILSKVFNISLQELRNY